MMITFKNLKNLVATGYSCTFGELLKVLHPSCGVGTGYSLQRRDKKPLPMSGEVGICHLHQQMAKIPGEGNIPQGMDLFAPSPEAVRLIYSPTASTLSRQRERGGQSPLLCATKGTQGSSRLVNGAFTLAETLITLGVIGVVAAVTMPTLLTNVQERINKEKVRTVKYKLTQATDKMKALDKIGPYETTEKFLDELKQHMTIAKICDNTHLTECWPTATINVTNEVKNVSGIKNGQDLMSLALGTSATTTMGIVTGDGTPMILVYSPVCTALDPAKSYTWSVVDGKPETNASTNCVSAIFDINGAKGPNKLGQDVRTLNSLFGYQKLTPVAMSKDECEKSKKQLGINECYNGNDYWAGAVKACHDLGLHLPSPQTLANIAGARYGRSDIAPYTLIMRNGYSGYPDCHKFFEETDTTFNYRLSRSEVICVGDGTADIPIDSNSTVKDINDFFWSNFEVNANRAIRREIISASSTWFEGNRNQSGYFPLCVGD